MEQVIRQATQADVVEPSVPGVSWAAVLAGAVASLALTLVLLSFGAGMGFSVVSPWGNSGVSATTFKIGTGLYFIVMAMISSAIGGYLAGRAPHKMGWCTDHGGALPRYSARLFGLGRRLRSRRRPPCLASKFAGRRNAFRRNPGCGQFRTVIPDGPLCRYAISVRKRFGARSAEPVGHAGRNGPALYEQLPNGNDLNPGDRT